MPHKRRSGTGTNLSYNADLRMEHPHDNVHTGARHETSYRVNQDLLKKAEDVANFDKGMGFRETLRIYRKAAVWSVVLSTALIMEGYDVVIVRACFAPWDPAADWSEDQQLLRAVVVPAPVRSGQRPGPVLHPGQLAVRIEQRSKHWSGECSDLLTVLVHS
jgi:hypothetical protein